MIEIQGWIAITLTEHEEETTNLQDVIIKVNMLLKPLNQLNQYFEVKNINGNYLLFIGLCHNHNIDYDKDIYKLLNKIGGLARGSYGLVYIRSHDDVHRYNKFEVYRLAKGRISIKKDNLLSPCIPIIED